MWDYTYYPTTDELYHHGILGMHWGKRNGPPYPLSGSAHSSSEKKAGWRKSLDSDGRVAAAKKNKQIAKKNAKNAKAIRKERQKMAIERHTEREREIEKRYERGQTLSKKDLKREAANDRRLDKEWSAAKKQQKKADKAYKQAKKEYKQVKKEVYNSPEAVARRHEIGKKAAKVALGAAIGTAVVGGAVVVAKSGVGRKSVKKSFEPKLISNEIKKADNYWAGKPSTKNYWSTSTGKSTQAKLAQNVKPRFRGNDLPNNYSSLGDLSMDELYRLLK